ncbi:type VII secretion system ESX-2 associated protein EspG2 [Mycobacterium cookii]|uniref:ESX-2 secretion-associated protein EspG2 n=1 Tax=Mycobacterium cookii TaxID=1775 RepID=A0A7I7KYQ1_9MYCO|nr:ESX secretion-associated protein EspG [Mycobacterium cookii]MCV7333297.1 ESX secretion-associated protein EspG [Mycobacterium cookii]BBX47083.1 ESX-2 secretion-associated protein EspG2 [Mycobacterium cookii]
MLTTTVDGLWVLQILTGIETIAPELGLRSIRPSVETRHAALAHPIVAELRDAGVIDESATVDPAVVEWLTVLSRRDVALLVSVRTPDNRDKPSGALLARFAEWWVVIERSEDVVRIAGAGTSTAEGAANAIIRSQIERLCGANIPARLRPVTLDADALREKATSRDALDAFLLTQRLDNDQVQILKIAADPERSAQAGIVALQSGQALAGATRTHVEQSAVTIIDTPEGRLVAEHEHSGGKRWMILAPGTASNIATAVNRMMRRLPANEEWFSYRKVV